MTHLLLPRRAQQLVNRVLSLPSVRIQSVQILGQRTAASALQGRCYTRILETRNTLLCSLARKETAQLNITFLLPKTNKTLLLRSIETVSQRSGPKSHSRSAFHRNNTTVAIYVIAVTFFVLGGSYAAVPLYRLYCQASGLGGTTKQVDADKVETMERVPERMLTIRFNADTSAAMQWSFRPQQSEIKLAPGETALAFYTAKNPTDVAITGISTYNVIPFEVGQYFNKIQCFCFEEQRLNPREEVDMPVFFFIDPEFTEDPSMAKINDITLSYTFFEAKEADDLGIQSIPH